jgi:sepiapterin reductase
LEVFGPSRHELDQARSATVTDPTSQGYTCELIFVNISSLCALEPFLTNGLYCTGKAAREMHHRAIALEQKATPRVKTLNYSPGPMDTDMQSCFRVSKTVHSELKKIFTTMKENGTLVPPNESSYICVDLLLENSYESGAHVDYYDIVGLARDHYKE